MTPGKSKSHPERHQVRHFQKHGTNNYRLVENTSGASSGLWHTFPILHLRTALTHTGICVELKESKRNMMALPRHLRKEATEGMVYRNYGSNLSCSSNKHVRLDPQTEKERFEDSLSAHDSCF